MSSKTVYAIAFAIFGMGTRFLVFILDLDFSWAVQLYFLFLLLAIFMGIRESVIQNRQQSFGALVKAGAQVGAVFSLLVAVFTYVFYRFVDTTFFEFMKEERMRDVVKIQPDPEKVEAYRANLDLIFSANTQSLATLLGFMFMTVFFSLIVALLFKKVPFLGRAL